MIVRNLQDPEVLETTYIAHGGAIAQMILDSRTLKEIGFLAIARLDPGKTIEAHRDPMEEIYFVVSGEGTVHKEGKSYEMKKGDMLFFDKGDKYWVKGNQMEIVIVTAPPWFFEQYEIIT